MSLFDNLNLQQQQAVKHTASPLMVIAGAGSGKTRVITSKICYMIQALGIKPEASSGDTIRNLAVTTHTTSQKRAENNGKSYV